MINLPADEWQFSHRYETESNVQEPTGAGWILLQVTPIPVVKQKNQKVAITHWLWARKRDGQAYR